MTTLTLPDIDTIDAALAALPAERQRLEQTVSEALDTLAKRPDDPDAVAVLTQARAALDALPRRESALELDRMFAAQEAERARTEAARRELQALRKADADDQKQQVKLVKALGALILKRSQRGAQLAALRWATPGVKPDPVADALDDAQGALALALVLLTQAAEARTAPGLGLIGKAKLAAVDGVPLAAVKAVEDYYQALISGAQQAAAQRQFAQVMQDAAQALAAAQRAYPVVSGANESVWGIQLERLGVSQQARNAVRQRARQAVQPEAEPPAPVVSEPPAPAALRCPRCGGPVHLKGAQVVCNHCNIYTGQ